MMETRTVQEVADTLKVAVATVYQLCARGKLAHLRVGVGRGTIRIRQEDLDAFIAGATVQPDMPTAPKPRPMKLKHLKV
jgi:excisionase family DNA binding protein